MMSLQTYLNENKEELFKEIPGLITAEYYENPDRIMLVVNKQLETLPTKELDGVPIVFEQMVLGGTIIQTDALPDELIRTNPKTADRVPLTEENLFGKECLTPHNAKSRNKSAVKAWKERHKNVKVV